MMGSRLFVHGLCASKSREPNLSLSSPDRKQCDQGEGFIRKKNLKLHLCCHLKQDCSESLHAEITQLQREVKEMDSRLNRMEVELEQLQQLTEKGTCFTLSPSVQLPSCAELE
ncbi:C2H2 transcription factor [Blastomyces gilchristii SLH14081]|uniref:C2H2 transcription factor n=1 Tax=Blastomyces gilchristii (strain SLH14081) TaxID=559298 RepID=A0A179UGZ2_BLAGS|nr:C2H2 transcription factor [Blastomyces gilchristii SLH14081]OAT07316.1 C2H2 transcription factor [Blastomyces gilchristii SLH14081]